MPWPDEWEKPYRDRPKVTMTVTRNDTLGGVLRAAMEELAVPPPSWVDEYGEPNGGDPFPVGIPFVAFYTPEDEKRFGSSFRSTVPILDEHGRVVFDAYDFDQITFAQLLESASATALEGDPLRPYLILHHEVGNGVVSTFTTLVNLWDLAWYVLDHIDIALGVGGGAYAAKKEIIDRLRSRTKAVRDVVSARGEQWMVEQKANPSTVAEFLAKVPRTTEQVAGLLGCSREEATGALYGFGLVRDPQSGLWYPGEDAEAKMLRGNLELIIYGVNEAELAKIFQERAEQLLETGETPDVVWPGQAAPDVEEG